MRRNYFFFTVLVITLTGLIGCGGGGSSAPAHAPSISNLWYSPHSTTVGSGYTTVTMSFDFSDAGGDISTFTVAAYNGGTEVLNQTEALLLSGYSAGNVQVQISGVPIMAVASYNFEIFVTDAAGATSNKLAGTFTVNP